MIPESIRRIKVSNIIYPTIIGLGVVGYMMYRNFDASVFGYVDFTWTSVAWLFVAVLCMLGRDAGYVARLKCISQGELSWMQSLRVILLWEFTSAITPSAIGGTSVAVVYIHKEGISVGRSSTMVLLTSFLDELYFVIMFPLMVSLIGWDTFMQPMSAGGVLSRSLVVFAFTGYSLKLLYTLLISYGLFKNPKTIKYIFVKLFSLRPLRRWRDDAINAGDEVIVGSQEIKSKGLGFWASAFGATFVSWSSRYLVANALIMALFSVGDHFLLFVRQLVMWIMMLVMPTPGGSGFAEEIFSRYCADMIDVSAEVQLGAVAVIVLLWRLVTFYPYLIAGALLFPRWLKSKF
ncbi:MAG: lysylphosphatidylglycerol synthase transmembrane domain-containing protein [Rikenellaceae bacterium]